MNSTENEFRDFLKKTKTQQGNNFKPVDINNLVSYVKDGFISKLKENNEDIDFSSLFEVNDIQYIKDLSKRCSKGNDLHDWSRSSINGNGKPSQALYQYINFLEQIKIKNENIIKIHSLNQILYGPPGTGKTYNTINKAIEIIENKIVSDDEDRDELKNKFDEYKQNGQIEFITFHQSYGYEEFVEGIKADLDSDEIKYKLEEGVFKKLCIKANTNYENSLKDKEILTKEEEFYQKLEILKDKINDQILQNGLYQLSDTKVYIESTTDNSFRYKSDNWKNAISMSFKDLKTLYINDVTERKIIKQTNNITRTAKEHASYFIRVLSDLYSIKIDTIAYEKEPLKNYILIIDEINRGNISKIFGELITLIEPSKRIGADEEIKLTLPNSSEAFGVPKNLYIIGTMNTADRSIAQIDTALRRRFTFEEMMPKPELLVFDNDENKPLIIEIYNKKINVQEILKAINERIEYIYDREHTIGHSYFMSLLKEPTKENLDEIFKVNIIPLLAEYFYGDWEDIIEVLNDDKGYFIINKTDTLKYKPKKDRGNKVYTIRKNFEVDGYINIYKSDE